MREFSKSQPAYTGSLLVAHPDLLDPNFRKTAVFITSSEEEEGAHGLIINRPTGNTVGEMLSSQEIGALSALQVYIGGPVGQDRLTFAVFEKLKAGGIVCRPHLEITEAAELAGKEGGSVRAFVGYSGWSAGQLEKELSQKSWIVRDPSWDMIDPRRLNELWTSVMNEMGPMFRLLASAPDDPSLN